MSRGQWFGFVVFCLLAGSRWLLESAYPSSLPPLLGQSFHFALAGLVGWAVWLRGSKPLPIGWWRVAFAGLLLLGVPALLEEWAGSQASPALYALVPLFLVVGVSAREPESGTRRLMLPALAGAAGALLILPFALPSTFHSAATMGVALVAVASIAVGSIWLYALLRGSGLAAAVWLVCAGNAVLLGFTGLFFEGPKFAGVAWVSEVVRTVLFILPEVVLLLWLLRAIRPERVAAKALFVPLVTVFEGLMLLRPKMELRTVVGVALLLFGGGALLLWKNDAAGDEPVRLRL